MRVLLTGALGQLGTELRQLFDAEDHHELIATDALEGAGSTVLDITDRDAVLAALTTTRPDVVIHPAAFTAVDLCETEVDTAYRVNVLGTRHIMEGARLSGAHVVYVSTDYVFDGTKDSPYVEWDAPNPQSVYGYTKLGGEMEIDPGHTIARTSWVCGFHGNNMVKTILRVADGEGPLRFVDDQRGHPTFAGDLALMLKRLATERRPGRFHVTNQGAVSWYEFARAVLESAGHDASRVEAISTAQLDPPRPAPRPANSVLDNAALRLSDVPLLPFYRETLDRLVARLMAQ